MTKSKYMNEEQLPNIKDMEWNFDPRDYTYFIHLKYVKGNITINAINKDQLYFEKDGSKISERREITLDEALELAIRDYKIKTFE